MFITESFMVADAGSLSESHTGAIGRPRWIYNTVRGTQELEAASIRHMQSGAHSPMWIFLKTLLTDEDIIDRQKQVLLENTTYIN